MHTYVFLRTYLRRVLPVAAAGVGGGRPTADGASSAGVDEAGAGPGAGRGPRKVVLFNGTNKDDKRDTTRWVGPDLNCSFFVQMFSTFLPVNALISLCTHTHNEHSFRVLRLIRA